MKGHCVNHNRCVQITVTMVYGTDKWTNLIRSLDTKWERKTMVTSSRVYVYQSDYYKMNITGDYMDSIINGELNLLISAGFKVAWSKVRQLLKKRASIDLIWCCNIVVSFLESIITETNLGILKHLWVKDKDTINFHIQCNVKGFAIQDEIIWNT